MKNKLLFPLFLPCFAPFLWFLYANRAIIREKEVSLRVHFIERKMAEERLNFAIIAAGEGSRLVEEGVTDPKPLVTVGGERLLERLLSLFVGLEAQSIAVIVNRQMTEVQSFLDAWRVLHPDVDLRVCVESTPSSMHSLEVLSHVIPEGRFVLTTVDTVFRPAEFVPYVQAFRQMEQGDGLFAVTRFVDDEKPLWIDACRLSGQQASDDTLHICSFSDTQGSYVSGGIYGLDTRTAFPVLRDCLASGQSRMRNFQRALLSAGLDIQAYEFEKIMDIDHKSDIAKAEAFLKAAER